MTTRTLPLKRTERLLVETLPEETLVYDLDRDEAHCLNTSAKIVWDMCDGQRTVAEAARELGDLMGAEANEAAVWVALRSLDEARLLEGTIDFGMDESRRAALTKIARVGAAAALVPIVMSIVAPTAVSAASCVGFEGLCSTTAQCCPPLVCTGGKCLG